MSVYTKFLSHCNGTDGSTIFIDDSPSAHIITAAGNAQVDTAQSKFGGASLYIPDSTSYIYCADSVDWYFGTGNLTIDFWVRFGSLPSPECIFIEQYQDWQNSFKFRWRDTNKLDFWSEVGNTTNAWYYCNWTPSVDTWYHIALVRNGSSMLMFINGISQSVTEGIAIGSNDLGNHSGPLKVGNGDNNYYVPGWMDEVRVSKGIARWTSNFPVPTSEYSSDIAEILHSQFNVIPGFDTSVDLHSQFEMLTANYSPLLSQFNINQILSDQNLLSQFLVAIKLEQELRSQFNVPHILTDEILKSQFKVNVFENGKWATLHIKLASPNGKNQKVGEIKIDYEI